MLKLNRKSASNIAKKLGMAAEDFRYKNLTEMVIFMGYKQNKKLSLSSELPFVGRENLLRDGVVTSQNINDNISSTLGL